MKLSASARAAALVLASIAWTAEARTITVDCDAGQKIGSRMLFALPGDTLLVKGSCNEHVVLAEHKLGLTLDGQGVSAEIRAPGADRPAVVIRARGTVLRGFRITGGRHGVSVQEGGYAVIDGNLIEGNVEDGINVNDHSWAGVINNALRGNGRDGIAINDNSSARVGFLDGQDVEARPNVIEDNLRGGLTVSRSSSARIAGNTFTVNRDYAVRLVRGAQADLAGNTMNGNLGGILVRENSTAILADAGGGAGAFLTAPNSGFNTQNGVRCRQAGVVSGLIGALTGASGATNLDGSCGNFIEP